ncbi:hypothetical protein ScPMuIL_013682 [Solemya velum]
MRRQLIKVCLKEHQGSLTKTRGCALGNTTTHIPEKELLPEGTSQTLEGSQILIKLPFTFAWTREYTVMLEAWDNDTTLNIEHFIDRAVHSGTTLPGRRWHRLAYSGPVATFIYRIRVTCDENYYTSTCNKFCRPRDDIFGHYSCGKDGEKLCHPGWLGNVCEIARCRTGCNSDQGSCDRPGECRCAFGWQGLLCDECIPFPGCKYGSCRGDPWTCSCNFKWGGILCDEDLDFCGRHFPCLNSGMCLNIAPDEYFCSCPPMYSGINCEINIDVCSSGPCTHGSTCINGSGGFHCVCPPGQTGLKCEHFLELEPAGGCFFQRRLYPENSSWGNECSTCNCRNGRVQCDKSWCGPKRCVEHSNTLDNTVQCQSNQICVVDEHEHCLTEPCIAWGHCENSTTQMTFTKKLVNAEPDWNSSACVNHAKITLLFEKKKLPIGVSVESICLEIRHHYPLGETAVTKTIHLECRIVEDGKNNAVDVFLTTNDGNCFQFTEPLPDAETNVNILKTVVDTLISDISHRQLDSNALEAVSRIQVETTYSGDTATYITLALFVILSMLEVACLVYLAVLHSRISRYKKSLIETSESPKKT